MIEPKNHGDGPRGFSYSLNYNILLSPSRMDPQAQGISANHVEATLPSG